ncbi:hypothetical protein [Actinacidiphila yeochonensis]|uniref:hypothetical protein n=1 Tax=Actinacidiphila yeochonensis TaxID=89050 RepID=UPI00056B1CB7|nr:hypothetical protein [Actinacidiphila yeochonensis]
MAVAVPVGLGMPGRLGMFGMLGMLGALGMLGMRPSWAGMLEPSQCWPGTPRPCWGAVVVPVGPAGLVMPVELVVVRPSCAGMLEPIQWWGWDRRIVSGPARPGAAVALPASMVAPASSAARAATVPPTRWSGWRLADRSRGPGAAGCMGALQGTGASSGVAVTARGDEGVRPHPGGRTAGRRYWTRGSARSPAWTRTPARNGRSVAATATPMDYPVGCHATRAA